MRQAASESSCVVVPDCGMQVPPPQSVEKAATGMTVGPVKVELAGVAKSTWNLKRFRLLDPKNTRKFGSPAGGAVVPSRSAGRTAPPPLPPLEHTPGPAPPPPPFFASYTHAAGPPH